jgi:CheY-like chemotaxis protein
MIFKQTPIQKVLLIGNDEGARALFASALSEAAPAAVLLEAVGFEAMQSLLQTQLPDLIFIDINMPRADGFNCLERLQADPLYRSIPVVMHGSASSPTQIAKAYSMGAALYFRRPSHFAVYIMAINKVLSLDWMHPDRAHSKQVRGKRYRVFSTSM